ncbi:hypothetical protein [Bordetella petrii]|uniref:hypothetical protein n=1 Tax=Bordetella petrii TaxID=94624 RepID=UPI001E62B1B7|nr:hypothetical protein [Bordetella petrii]MCD0501780.1 hypothetical protein [Bordetella petrii]
MKKLVWLGFIVLATLWTALVALALQLSDWLLNTVASAQLPDTLATAPWVPPAWAQAWLGPAFLESLQAAVAALLQGANQILPAFAGLGTVISILGWIFWGMIMAGLLAAALALHWLANRRQRSNAGPSGDRPTLPQ